MTRSLRSRIVGFFTIVAALSGVDVYAASLREIIDRNGRDYVLANAKTIAAQLEDRDKYVLARILIADLRGSEAPDILIPLAQKGDLPSIRILAVNFGLGKEGFKSNRPQTSIWTVKLENIAAGHDEKQRRAALGTLCDIYRDWNHLLYSKELAVKYCEALFNLPDAPRSTQAYLYLTPDSPLFDPVRGIAVYDQCIASGDAYCKMNYAWQGKQSIHIARRSTKRQLFEYASVALEMNSTAGINNLGGFFLEGFGTAQDARRALELYEKAANQNKDHALYNLLLVTFFKYADWGDSPKVADDAMWLISYYDYLSPESDRFDSVPFKEWVFSKGRLPGSNTEFHDFLIERAKSGSETAACMLAGHLRKLGRLGEGLLYAEKGRGTRNHKVRQWCEREIARIDVLNNIKP